MDLVFPTCSSTSQSTGVGRDCFLNIAYNKQKPLCAKSPGSFLGGIQSVINSVNKTCRSPNALCEADDDFSFDLNPDGDSFTSVPIDQLYPGTTSILFSEPSSSTSGSSEFTPHIPLKIGDYNVDGFPDVLVMVVNGTAQPPQGGIFGNGRSAGVQVKLLQNVACDKESQECQGGRWQAKRRRLQASQGDAMKVLDDIWDVRNSAWLDIDEDVGAASCFVLFCSCCPRIDPTIFTYREHSTSSFKDRANKMVKHSPLSKTTSSQTHSFSKRRC